MTNAYKLFRLRKDGTLGPLFIGQRIRVTVGEWQHARGIRTRGFAYRPGWHACAAPNAPHLSTRGRVWWEVSLDGAVTRYNRPATQGGLWYTAQWLRVERILVDAQLPR